MFEKCKYQESCGYEICLPEFCNEYEAVTMTNGDRIRSMTDDELAEFLCKRFNNCSVMTCPGAEICLGGDGKANGLKKWLKQPERGVD